MRKKRKKMKDSEQWALKHSQATTSWWKPSAFRSADAAENFPGLGELSARQLDMLESRRMQLPEPEPCCIDVNLS